jgi:hypothetical protein
MRFEVRGFADCLSCPAHGRRAGNKFLSQEVIAGDEAEAKANFLAKVRLCPACEVQGIKANLLIIEETVICTPLPAPVFKPKSA